MKRSLVTLVTTFLMRCIALGLACAIPVAGTLLKYRSVPFPSTALASLLFCGLAPIILFQALYEDFENDALKLETPQREIAKRATRLSTAAVYMPFCCLTSILVHFLAPTSSALEWIKMLAVYAALSIALLIFLASCILRLRTQLKKAEE